MSTVLTPKFRASYVHVFKPRAIKPGDKAKFSLTACYDQDAVDGDASSTPAGSISVKEMKKIALDAAFEKFGNTDEVKKRIKSGKIRMPFITPEEDEVGTTYPEGTVLVMRYGTPDDSTKPGVVDRYAGKDGRAATIEDPADFYSGCYARASVGVYAYDRPDSKGVTFMLNNVQKLGDGEPLAGGPRSATSDFAALDTSIPSPDGSSVGSDEDEDPMGLGSL